MANKDIALKWLEQVDEDIATAEALYSTGHWLYIGFLCHQAVEKVIKAYLIEQTKQFREWILQKCSLVTKP